VDRTEHPDPVLQQPPELSHRLLHPARLTQLGGQVVAGARGVGVVRADARPCSAASRAGVQMQGFQSAWAMPGHS
jgi:hypothetical protein